MSFDNRKWWPVAYRARETWTHAYRTQREAGVEGPFYGETSGGGAEYFAWGFCIGIMIGMGLIDIMEAMI